MDFFFWVHSSVSDWSKTIWVKKKINKKLHNFEICWNRFRFIFSFLFHFLLLSSILMMDAMDIFYLLCALTFLFFPISWCLFNVQSNQPSSFSWKSQYLITFKTYVERQRTGKIALKKCYSPQPIFWYFLEFSLLLIFGSRYLANFRSSDWAKNIVSKHFFFNFTYAVYFG